MALISAWILWTNPSHLILNLKTKLFQGCGSHFSHVCFYLRWNGFFYRHDKASVTSGDRDIITPNKFALHNSKVLLDPGIPHHPWTKKEIPGHPCPQSPADHFRHPEDFNTYPNFFTILSHVCLRCHTKRTKEKRGNVGKNKTWVT